MPASAVKPAITASTLRLASGPERSAAPSAACSSFIFALGTWASTMPAHTRVGDLQPMAGQREERAQRALQAGQEIAAADIGEEADGRLGHGEQELLARDRVRAVHREADAAAHVDAVDQRDPRLGVAVDAAVDDVLVAEEIAAQRARRDLAALAIEVGDVAAGAEGAVAGAAQHHGLDRRVLLPAGNDPLQLEDHAVRQRVQRLGPVERDERRGRPSPRTEFPLQTSNSISRQCPVIPRASGCASITPSTAGAK